MENEILGQILAELKSLNVRQGKVEEKLDSLDVRQNSMAEELVAFQEFTMQKFEKIEKRFDGLEGRFNGLENRFDGLETRFDGLETRFNGLESRFDGLEHRFDGLENEQKRLNVLLENEIRPSIQVLAEGHLEMQAQLDRIERKVTSHDEIIFRRVK